MKLLRVISLFAFVAITAAQTASPLSITIVDRETGKPVPQAQVVIARSDSATTQNFLADDAGRVVASVKPGTLTIKARHSNYLTAEYGQQSWNKPGAPLQITTTESRVVIRMTSSSTIHGTVVDQKGSRLSGIKIELLSPRYGEGERFFHEVQNTTTDDRGEFRFWGLQPDSYVLWLHTDYRLPRVEVSPGLMGLAPGNYIPPSLALPAYYPGGTRNPEESSLIDIGPGTAFEAGNLRVDVVTPVHVRGQVIDAVTGKPASKGRVTVLGTPLKWYQLEGATLDPSPRSMPLSENGTFDFYGLPPGTHRLTVRARDDERQPEARGVIIVTVDSTDIEGLQIAVKNEESLKIEGRLVVEGQQRDDQHIKFEQVQVSLQGDYTKSTYMRVRADGTFTMTGIGAEAYKLLVSNLPASWYVKRAELGTQNFLSPAIRVDGSPDQPLLITLSPNAAALQFIVRDDTRNAVHGARVVLLPAAASAVPVLQSFTDQSGSGRIEGIPPGEYKVFAFDDSKDGQWTFPPFISRYDSRASRIRITEGGVVTEEFTVISTRN
jgi:hypothetical protein